jgi:excisionase family DNA binding protein
MTVREVAEVLNVFPETVLRWHRSGDLPTLTMPGGSVRIREEDLEAWLKERETTRSATRKGGGG